MFNYVYFFRVRMYSLVQEVGNASHRLFDKRDQCLLSRMEKQFQHNYSYSRFEKNCTVIEDFSNAAAKTFIFSTADKGVEIMKGNRKPLIRDYDNRNIHFYQPTSTSQKEEEYLRKKNFVYVDLTVKAGKFKSERFDKGIKYKFRLSLEANKFCKGKPIMVFNLSTFEEIKRKDGRQSTEVQSGREFIM